MTMLRINLSPVRRCRNGHSVPAQCRRCPACDKATAERAKPRVQAYNKEYYKRRGPDYYRKKAVEYRANGNIREAHNAAERARKQDSRYAFTVLVRSYGIDVLDFANLLHAQSFCCAGCRAPLAVDRFTHIDHCHFTQQVRGLLCNGCNVALGQAKDSPETLRRLAAYLEKSAG